MKVSVIVPVYNVENYLAKCLDSLVNQTLQEIEIVVVNDGSTDNSQAVINEFQQKFPLLIKAFQKQNGGLSDARNYGISKVSGEYFMFVDADDYISTDTLKIVDKSINNDKTIKNETSISAINNKASVAISFAVKDSTLSVTHKELIRELEMQIDDYLSEQMMLMSENLKSWLRAEITQHLGEQDKTLTKDDT